MDFKDIIKNNKDDLIHLGYNDLGLLSVDLKKIPSIIITGETGTGKSILLDQIILQLINKYTSLEMNLVIIDTNGVELSMYADTRYALYSAINDNDKSIVLLAKILNEIERRKKILSDNNCLTIDEYNKYVTDTIPMLVIAIDEDKFLLRNPDVEKMLTGIITGINNLNIVLIMVTSDVHNKFFETDSNIFASMLISFDYTNYEEAKKANIDGSENLAIGEFLVKSKDKVELYHNFEFDDSIIESIIKDVR